MATLASQQIVLTGLAPTFAAAAGGGDKVPPGDHSFLAVRNASGSPITVTVDSVAPSNYGDDANLVVSIPATTGEKWIGPLTAQRFAGADGLVAVTYSGVTTLTVAAVRF